ncbi:uncharacterized protein LOC126778729 [Nymphalis io]|uniref:uncharacterized protein LOC126778729 n=1 Tax=Inachis io TaxID=171585 RepID=UPI00216939B0|nr:uncharacterized protein LOC126778729 [Nymphalis io]
MFYCLKAITVLWATTGMASISIRRAGWLDRMVKYHKNNFFEDLRNLPVVHIKAKIERDRGHDNNFYYDMDAGEYYADTERFDDHLDEENIIVVSNPVEARLPSASISVRLLKSILENRAKAGRLMPTTKKNIPWSTTSKKSMASSPDAPKDDKSSSASVSSTVAPVISDSTGDSAVTNQAEEKTTV